MSTVVDLWPPSPQHHLKPPIRLSHVVYLVYQHQLSSDIDACLKMGCRVEYLMMLMLLCHRYRAGLCNRPLIIRNTNSSLPPQELISFAFSGPNARSGTPINECPESRRLSPTSVVALARLMQSCRISLAVFYSSSLPSLHHLLPIFTSLSHL